MPQQWESAFDGAAIGMALVGLDGSWLAVNPALCRILGYTRSQLLAKTFQDITHPDDLHADLDNVKALLDGKIPSYEMEKRYRRKDESLVWCLLSVTLVRDVEGVPQHFISQIQDISGRKTAESHLAASEARYRSLFDEAWDGLFLTHPSGWMTKCNPAMSELCGYDWSELLGQSPADLIPEEEAAAIVAEAIRSGVGVRDLITRWKRRDGKELHVDLTLLPQFDDDGTLTGFQGRLHDLTTHQQAIQTERHFRAIVDASSDAIMAGDTQGRISAWNRGAERLFGYTAEEALGQSITLIAPPDRPKEPMELAARVRSGEDVIGHETVRLHKSGELVEISITISGIRNEDGELVGFSAISRDIRERRRVEAAAARREEQLRLLVDLQQEVAAAGVDRNRVVRLIARQVRDITGADGAAILEPHGEGEMTVAAATGLMESLTGEVIPVDGSLAGRSWLSSRTLNSSDTTSDRRVHRSTVDALGVGSVAASPIKDDTGMTAVLEIASTRQAAFDSGSLHTLELISGVMAGALRTASAYKRQEELLAEREAYADELERSNVSLQEFASIASHDLQEPLRKVRAFGDRLKKQYSDELDERGRDYIGRMQNAATRMQQLIEDLLNYSRVTSAASPFTTTDLSEVLAGVITDLSERIHETGAGIEVDDLPSIEADPTQVRQLFQNLIANALKFAREDVCPRIVISCEVSTRSVEIDVEDNGVGFEPGYAEQIFRPFERLHGRSEYEGTGMGLAICRKIVERHGGRLRAFGRPGEGATFKIQLPRKQWMTI